MLDRVKFGWRVQLQGEDGSVTRREIHNYWSPDKEGTAEAIGEAAAGEAFAASGCQKRFMAVSVERIAA